MAREIRHVIYESRTEYEERIKREREIEVKEQIGQLKRALELLPIFIIGIIFILRDGSLTWEVYSSFEIFLIVICLISIVYIHRKKLKIESQVETTIWYIGGLACLAYVIGLRESFNESYLSLLLSIIASAFAFPFTFNKINAHFHISQSIRLIIIGFLLLMAFIFSLNIVY